MPTGFHDPNHTTTDAFTNVERLPERLSTTNLLLRNPVLGKITYADNGKVGYGVY
jgi:hypothetical protein